jgi:hypothetical protein
MSTRNNAKKRTRNRKGEVTEEFPDLQPIFPVRPLLAENLGRRLVRIRLRRQPINMLKNRCYLALIFGPLSSFRNSVQYIKLVARAG